ncbi:MAG: iron-sulfur cluster assembly accessory protein [Alphaproteobacteria bacterium]|nr:iron-sulfur cluster assembly accessory protein [Alphaproteobacteria bacterium]
MSATSILTVTAAAAARLQEIVTAQEPRPEAVMVSVTTKGCSGMKYDLQLLPRLADAPPYADRVETNGLTVVIDPKAALFITGSTMDYQKSALHSGFDFINPNETARCGCGESFSVATTE